MGHPATVSAEAYAVVPGIEEEVAVIAVEGTGVELHQPAAHLVSGDFANLPEAQGLSWRDDFFEDGAVGYGDIVAVFDFDYDSMESHYKCRGWSCLVLFSVCCPSTVPWLLLGLVPCKLNNNVNWNVRAQHIALTRNGILFVHDRRPVCWGESFCTATKRTAFIPYEEIIECTVTNGYTTTSDCNCGGDLSRVTVKTAGSPYHQFHVIGLENPQAFHKLAMTLKRGSPLMASVASCLSMVERNGDAPVSGGGQDVAALLRDIRDELRENNEALRALSVQKQGAVQPSAPLE